MAFLMGEYIFHYPLPQVRVSCLSGTRRWTEPVWQLSDRPRHPFGPLTFELVSYPALAGRGGSVSRRDHNQAAGASLREAASPPASPRHRRAEGFVLPRRKVAAALSAAVTTTPKQENAPTHRGAQVRRKAQAYSPPLFGRRGLGRRGFSQRSRLLPRISVPPPSFPEGARGRGLFYRKVPSLAYIYACFYSPRGFSIVRSTLR